MASVAVLGAATLAGGAYASRDAAVEWWWIWKLRSAGSGERNAAAEKLVQLESLRAVPHLIEAVRRDGTEEVLRSWVRVYPPAGSKFRVHSNVKLRAATPLVLALWNQGDPAVPALRAALEREKQADSNGRMVKILKELLDRRAAPLTPQNEQTFQARR